MACCQGHHKENRAINLIFKSQFSRWRVGCKPVVHLQSRNAGLWFYPQDLNTKILDTLIPLV